MQFQGKQQLSLITDSKAEKDLTQSRQCFNDPQTTGYVNQLREPAFHPFPLGDDMFSEYNAQHGSEDNEVYCIDLEPCSNSLSADF